MLVHFVLVNFLKVIFMISKANSFVALAVAALAMPLTAGRGAVAESMLDNYTVKKMGIAQVNDAGNAIVVVTVNSGASGADETRVVSDNKGAIKLYTAVSSTDSLMRGARFIPTTDVIVKRKLKAQTIGDPVAELKASHKAFSKEVASSGVNKVNLTTSKNAAIAQQWDDVNVFAADTAQNLAYVDILLVLGVVTELNDYAVARKAALGAQLTAAGVNP